MQHIRPILHHLSASAIATCIMVGVALGVSNVLVNHVHWFGAYLISCSGHDWSERASRTVAPISTPRPVVGQGR